MPELSYAAVFLGGVLAILSPCSALLLPAFFAVAFTSRVQLARAALLFYAGLATIFVPLGLGISFVASLFFEQRPLIILLAGALLVGGNGGVILAEQYVPTGVVALLLGVRIVARLRIHSR